MQTLSLTLPTPAENLALDEGLLDAAEACAEQQGILPTAGERLRIWESDRPMVVLGRSSRVDQEVDLTACRARGIPVLRRSSGGATIVTGPGCLMYAVVLSYSYRPELRALDRAHALVLERLVAALGPHVPGLARQGTSDLAIGDRKVSGNSLRCKRRYLLYHGTLLYDFPLDLVGSLLKTPPRQPDYRRRRDHLEFVTNLPLDAATIRTALPSAWDATEAASDWPQTLTAELVQQRYATDAWNLDYP